MTYVDDGVLQNCRTVAGVDCVLTHAGGSITIIEVPTAMLLVEVDPRSVVALVEVFQYS